MIQPIWITEQDVVELLDLGDAIAALEQGLRREANGQAQNIVKTHSVFPLSHLLAESRKRRPTDDLTLFKAMGMGISDLALGAEICARAVKAGRGRPFPHPQRAKPQLHVSRAKAVA